jgi:serpin B
MLRFEIGSLVRRSRFRPFLLGGVAALLFSGGATSEVKPVPEDVRSVAHSGNRFAIDLYARLAAEAGGDNLFFSPASISTALAMTSAGARGQTAAEMKQVLHLALVDEQLHPAMGSLARTLGASRQGCELSIANALWGQRGYPFLSEFVSRVGKHYEAGLKEVDFREATEQARVEINDWVEERTRQRIKDLIPPDGLDTRVRMVLTNAIYFKGTWETQFDSEQTRAEAFHLESGRSVDVDMMRLANQRFPLLVEKRFRAVELPYEGNRVSMVVLLPEPGVGLAELESELTLDNLDDWLGRMAPRKLDALAIPRFKMTRRYGLAPHLAKLGMPLALSSKADFSGMSSAGDLFVSDVLHEAFVEVNEEGTEAAAATGVVVRTTSFAPPLIFRADRPFLFLIRDRDTGSILFLGRLTDPS